MWLEGVWIATTCGESLLAVFINNKTTFINNKKTILFGGEVYATEIKVSVHRIYG